MYLGQSRPPDVTVIVPYNELITKRQLMKRTCTIYKRNCKLQSVTDTGHFCPEDDSLFNRQQNKVSFLYSNALFYT